MNWVGKALGVSVMAVGLSIGASSLTAAAPEAHAGGANDTRLVLLGTAGGPPPRKLRSEPASLLVVDGRPYLIDAGDGVVRQLDLAGYRSVDLAAIFVTHHHFDHNADVGTLIAQSWLGGRKTPLPIIGPFGTEALVKAGLDYFSISQRIFGTGVPARPPASTFVRPHDIVGTGVIYQDDRVRVTAAENSHYQIFDPGEDRSYAYRFDTARGSVVFTGDTGPSGNLVQLAKGADILVSEVVDVNSTIAWASGEAGMKPDPNSPMAEHMRRAHLSPEEVGKLAAASGVKMVVLTHVVPGLDNEKDMHRYTDGVQRYFKGSVIGGRDLTAVPLRP